MRTDIPAKLEEGRLYHPDFVPDGLFGAFQVFGPCGEPLRIISSGDGGWEHVSVSSARRVPNWQEMCFVKDLFWDAHECVVQFHPPKADYVNNHKFVLHLWRCTDQAFPMPPHQMVGSKEWGEIKSPAEARLVRELMRAGKIT